MYQPACPLGLWSLSVTRILLVIGNEVLLVTFTQLSVTFS